MHLIIITGFLGSGKTTLLLEIAKKLSSEGKKVAIIENEVGELGIDDCIIKENGYNVKEIYSGCICCSLRLDLITTLLAIERDHDPEIVILEPSGVAGPKQVLSALQGYGGEIDNKIVINIVDSARYSKLETLNLPIIIDGIQTAGVVVLNKKDLVSKTGLCELRKKLENLNPKKIISVSMLEDGNVNELIDEISSEIGKGLTLIGDAEVKNMGKEMPEPAIFTFDNTINIKEDTITRFTEFLIYAGARLREENAVIGHIKIMLNGGKNGYLMLSLTSSEHPPVIKGTLKATKNPICLRINAIAYNISNDKMSEIFQYLTEKELSED